MLRINEVSDRIRVTEALTTDHHFVRAGFGALLTDAREVDLGIVIRSQSIAALLLRLAPFPFRCTFEPWNTGNLAGPVSRSPSLLWALALLERPV
jgi:hypothetical protein